MALQNKAHRSFKVSHDAQCVPEALPSHAEGKHVPCPTAGGAMRTFHGFMPECPILPSSCRSTISS
jgi:hypothetical protein